MGADEPEPTEHRARVVWEGTKEDLRAHRVELASQTLLGSSMPETGGDGERADPEETFVGALSACHMLWFLALARERKLRVVSYVDEAVGELDGERITRVEPASAGGVRERARGLRDHRSAPQGTRALLPRQLGQLPGRGDAVSADATVIEGDRALKISELAEAARGPGRDRAPLPA